MKRPATIEQATTLRRREISLAETSPYRRVTASTHSESFGPYVVHEKLGEGGMAYVHRAELVSESGLRKQVALKRLRTDISENPELVSAFVHEAQLAAKLQHPNIAQAYDLGKIDGTYYIAMELVPGPTLAQLMAQSRNGAGAVPLPIALELLIQICDALDHAHDLRDERGRPLELVHRDVSPMNIIISRTGAAKLIDFGIAKVRSARHATEAGIIKGKHAYVAPEYTYGRLDRRADVFGLGVVAHELLTGRRLFLGETELETIDNIREKPVAPPSRFASGISQELDSIVLTALERDPEKRWQSAGAMRVALAGEVRRLGVVISGPQIRDWIEWALQQSPRRDSSVDRLLDGLDRSVSISIEIECPPASVPCAPSPVVARSASALRAPSHVVAPPAAAPLVPTAPAARAPTAKPTHALIAPVFPPSLIAASVVAPPVIAPRTRRVVRRAPPWRTPTRWVNPPRRRSTSPLILLALIAFAALALDQRWIDLDRWREIIDAYVA